MTRFIAPIAWAIASTLPCGPDKNAFTLPSTVSLEKFTAASNWFATFRTGESAASSSAMDGASATALAFGLAALDALSKASMLAIVSAAPVWAMSSIASVVMVSVE